MPNDKSLKLPSYGGQALMEGVMMRGKNNAAMAVRAPDGEIVIYQEELQSSQRPQWTRFPFIRGVFNLWDSMALGMRFLTKSANISSGEEEVIEGKALTLTVILSLIIAVALFFLLPAFLAGLIEKQFSLSPWWSNLVEGAFRLIILIAYMAYIGRIPEIRRVYAYHGAEHKTINAFENNIELTPIQVSEQSLVHPRCGTSFMLTLVLISIVIFTLVGPLPLHWRLISRVLMIPIVAGMAYEYIRFAANTMDRSALMRWLIKPNLWLQKLTTREPDLEMLEVSIKAFKTMFEVENQVSPT